MHLDFTICYILFGQLLPYQHSGIRNNCTAGQFSCLTPNWHNSTFITYDCMDELHRCDGNIDCQDHSDEYEVDGKKCKR